MVQKEWGQGKGAETGLVPDRGEKVTIGRNRGRHSLWDRHAKKVIGIYNILDVWRKRKATRGKRNYGRL